MRIVFIGCVEFSYAMLDHLLKQTGTAEVVGVVSREESAFNTDFKSLKPLADSAGIPCYLVVGKNQSDLADWLKLIQPDVIYCFGWSYLLQLQILQIPELGVVGYHPAALPRNRGRHPIIWTLALGLPQAGSTFFFMDEGADSGDILSQRFLPVEETDDAASLYSKLIGLAKKQVTEFTRNLACREYLRQPQNHKLANSWRKRSKIDGWIDWRMPAKGVCNLVRALARPYAGAHCLYKEKDCKVWKVKIADGLEGVDNIEPGKVLDVNGDQIRIKCGVDAIDLIEHELLPLPGSGDYL